MEAFQYAASHRTGVKLTFESTWMITIGQFTSKMNISVQKILTFKDR